MTRIGIIPDKGITFAKTTFFGERVVVVHGDPDGDYTDRTLHVGGQRFYLGRRIAADHLIPATVWEVRP